MSPDEWLDALGVLVTINPDDDEADAKAGIYLPMLLMEFTAEDFDAESLQLVAAQCAKGFPLYPDLRRMLLEHREMLRYRARAQHLQITSDRTRRVSDPGIPERVCPLPTEEDKARVAAMVGGLVAELRAKDAERTWQPATVPAEKLARLYEQQASDPNTTPAARELAARRLAELRGEN
jgi:hypothetical protein